ncbi:uncharacterized protein LOC142689490 [Rhinoderma darwinii]|uniref:uncharacterized protein LOC142689490 n=1 Tax=Rhinoderma darwinii TaxID=43563 RepID=UPI003F67565E
MQGLERSTRSSKRYVPVSDPAPGPDIRSGPADTGQYMCIECSETFDSKLELNSHRQSHVTKKQFTCSHCGRGFHHQVFLQMHERSHEAGVSRTSGTRTTAARVISTRSSKPLPSPEVDILHVSPPPTKSPYHLNSRVEFKTERKGRQDFTPRECVTRRTQGASPPARQRRESSDNKSQFELRISKLHDTTVQLIDPFGNTLEILAEVFNTYAMGASDEEGWSPPGDTDSSISEVPTAPTSSIVPMNMADKITDVAASPQNLEVDSPSPDPHEPINEGGMEEDLPLCHIQSLPSASVSPMTVPEIHDDDVDNVSTQCPPESDKERTTEEDAPPPATSVQDSSINSDGDEAAAEQAEGPVVEDLTLSTNDRTLDTATGKELIDASLKGNTPDDRSSPQLNDSEAFCGDPPQTEGSPSLSKPVSPEPLTDIDHQELEVVEHASPHPPTGNHDQDVAATKTQEDIPLDVSEDGDPLVTSGLKDRVDSKIDPVACVLVSVHEDNMLTQKRGPEGPDLDEGEHPSTAEVPLTPVCESLDTLEDDETSIQRPLTPNERVSQSNEHPEESDRVSSTRDPGSSGLDLDSPADPYPAADISTPHTNADSQTVNYSSDGNQTIPKRDLESGLSEGNICRISQGVHDEASPPTGEIDVPSSETISLDKTSLLMEHQMQPDSERRPDERSVAPSDPEGESVQSDDGEKVIIPLEDPAAQPDDMLELSGDLNEDLLSQIASDTMPVLQEVVSPPQLCQEPGEVGHTAHNTSNLVLDPTQEEGSSSEQNPKPEEDPKATTDPNHDLQAKVSSNPEQDVNLRDHEEMDDDDVSHPDVSHIVSFENEELQEEKNGGQDEGGAAVETPAEDISLSNIENKMSQDSEQEKVQTSVHVLKCADDVEGIAFPENPVVGSCEESPISLPEPKAASVEDGLLPPPEDGLLPPPEDGLLPPPEDGLLPPPEDGLLPPPEDGLLPPPEDGLLPPPEDGLLPPPEDGLLPPPEDGLLPPPEDGLLPPPEDGLLPPPEDGLLPPPEDGLLPPPEDGLLPPPEDGLLPPPDDEEDLSLTDYKESPDVSLNEQILVNVTSTCVQAEETKPTEGDTAASLKGAEEYNPPKSIENPEIMNGQYEGVEVTFQERDLNDDALPEKREEGETPCPVEPALDLASGLEDLSEKCSLSSDDVKEPAESDPSKSLPQGPSKQYIQMSNADLTEHDLADGFVDSGTILLNAPNLDEAAKEDDVSAVSGDGDETPVNDLSDLLEPEAQESEYTEGPDDKHVGVGGQCLKCGKRVRRGRKELVWFPVCYKCRLKAKREERHSNEGSCRSPDFVLEKDLKKKKKGSSDFSNFQIKQESHSAPDDVLYRTVKSVASTKSTAIKQEPAAVPRKTYKCQKCDKSFRIPALLAGHMKCHALPQCLTCGCPIRLKYKTKRIPRRCHKCFQKIKQQRKEEGEGDSLDSDQESLYMDEADLKSLTSDNEPENDQVLSSTKLTKKPLVRPGSVKRGHEPFHSTLMRKRKTMNPAIQALYCSCNVVLKSGAKPPKICKNCQKPVRNRKIALSKASSVAGHHVDVAHFIHGQSAGGRATPLKKPKKSEPGRSKNLSLGEASAGWENALSPSTSDGESCKDEEAESCNELTMSDLQDGEKPRLCPQCGKIFKCNRSLNLHLLSHTATQCESCGCRLQKKKRAGRWSKKCRVCRLLGKDLGLPDSAVEESLASGKVYKEKNTASLRLKMKQSKIVRSRKIQSIAKHKKDLRWMNMIMAVKGLTRKPRKKKQSLQCPSQEKPGDRSETAETNVYSATEGKDLSTLPKCEPGSSGTQVSQKKILGAIPKVNRKCMYREKNIIKVEEKPLLPYMDLPSSAPVSVKEEEENQCLECHEIFPSFDLLLSHQRSHVEAEPFTCPQCPQSFSTEHYLNIHVGAHTDGPPFRCPECNKTFPRRNNLGVHRRVHTGARPYACPDCPCRFRQKGSLIIHRYTHRNLQLMLLKPYQCSICNKSFKQKERLVIHERLHTGECPFSCKDCDQVFPSKSRLYSHRKIHKIPEASSGVERNASGKEESGGQSYQCKDCGKVCSTKASFVLHCKVHKSPAIVDQTGSHPGNLELATNETPNATGQDLHIKTEPEGNPFSCQDCGKVCSTKASFVLHCKVHRLQQKSDGGGSATFICKDCNKVCSTKASLVLHRKVHRPQLIHDLKANAADPPFICQDCNKICSTKASFVLHCKVHKASSSNEQILNANLEQKSFVCNDCGFVCSTKASYVLHKKVHRSSPNLKEGAEEHPFTCKDCNKVCSTKASFVLHCKVHRALPSSDQSFIPKGDVEEKPFHCKDCDKIYSTKGRLLAHSKLHSGQEVAPDGEQQKIDAEEKPFACPMCHMRFTRLKILVRHKLIHGEDVFRCGHCGKRFLFQKSLMNHVPVCLKRSKGKSLLGKEKATKKRKSKDGSNNEAGAPKKRKGENKKAVTAVQKLKQKKLIKAKKLALYKEKSKAKTLQEKKQKKARAEAELEPETEGKKTSSDKPSDGKPEKLPETPSKEKESGKDKKPKDVGKVKKTLKKVPPKQKQQRVSSASLKKWRIIAAATVKKRKLQAVISGGKKKVTVKKKGPAKAKTGGKNGKE